LKIATRKSKISPNFIMCGLSSVLILEWGGLLSRAAGSRLGWISRAAGGLICMSSSYIKVSVWKSQRRYCPEEIGEFWRTVMIMVT
jgi:hypothetical protein